MLANIVRIAHPYLGHRALHDVGDFHPKLSGVRLGPGNWTPVIANVFVLTGDLAIVAAVTYVDIDDHNLHRVLSLVFQPLQNVSTLTHTGIRLLVLSCRLSITGK
jgi:hypothetical protein